MAKIIYKGEAPPDDPVYKEGYTITVQPSPEELKKIKEEYRAWKAAGKPPRKK
jgi:hypothetical protein